MNGECSVAALPVFPVHRPPGDHPDGQLHPDPPGEAWSLAG